MTTPTKELELKTLADQGHMTQSEYFQLFEQATRRMLETTTRKNTDYAAGHDAFKNFRLIEEITGGYITKELGVLLRITDKISRLGTLLVKQAKGEGGPLVTDERACDTAHDTGVYSTILEIMLRHPGR